MTLAYGDDMVIGSRRVQPQAAIAGSEVVFVGYGIHAPEAGWNDYAGVDMRGKTALILVNDPGFVTGDEALFRGKAMTYHGRWTYKFEEASRQGAAAAIIVHETAPASYDWGVVRNSWSGPQFYLDREDGNAGRTALEGWITEGARAPAHGAGRPGPGRAEGGCREARFQAGSARGHRDGQRAERGPPQALAERRRPDAGQGPPGRVRHLHGALGPPRAPTAAARATASTTARWTMRRASPASSTIAKAYRDMLPGASRSVLFLAVTAEESGLLGSEFYAEHPLVPLEKTAAVINIDALNPLGRAKDLEVVGFGASELEDLLAAAAKSKKRTLAPDRKPEAGRFYRSDQFNFAKEGVPALYIKSGTTLRDAPEGAGQGAPRRLRREALPQARRRVFRRLGRQRLDRGPAPALRGRRARRQCDDLAALARGQRVPAGAREEREEPRAGRGGMSGSGRPAQRAGQQPDGRE